MAASVVRPRHGNGSVSYKLDGVIRDVRTGP